MKAFELIKDIAKIGTSSIDDEDLRHSVFLNNLNGIVFLVMDFVIGCAFYALTGRPITFWVMLAAGSAFFATSIGFNALGLHNVARLSTGFIGSVLVSACCIYFGKETYALASFLLGALFPLLYFKASEYKYIAVGLMVPFLNAVALTFMDIVAIEPQAPDAVSILIVVFLGIPYFGIAVNLLTLKRINEKQKAQLRDNEENISTLVRIICHDVANPAMVLKNTLGRIEERVKDPSELERKDLARAAKAINTIISILKTVRKSESAKDKKLMLSIAAFEPKDAINNIVMLYEAQCREKNLGIKIVDERKSPSSILADEDILSHQILANLLSNAIKFSLPGSSITIAIADSAGDYVALRVEDHGVGIAKHRLDRLFRWNTSSSTLGTAGEKGTGYGLPLVKQYVEKMDGSIAVTSRCKDERPNDCGTTFIVKLPKATAKTNTTKIA